MVGAAISSLPTSKKTRCPGHTCGLHCTTMVEVVDAGGGGVTDRLTMRGASAKGKALVVCVCGVPPPAGVGPVKRTETTYGPAGHATCAGASFGIVTFTVPGLCA